MAKQDIKDCLRNNYLPYAVSMIVDRAIVSIDGMKPSYVKLLYTMYKMGLNKSSRTKSANIVGQTMKLNPHGDQAIYETMVRLTKGYGALNIPYVDSKGNFGKVYSRDMAYAASRYTEAKLMPIAEELFKGIEENAVDMVDNYDGKLKEPSMLPVTFPTILSNVSMGIAVGIASNICSFNLDELCDYTIDYLNGENPNNLIPDFSTGGELILENDVIENINSNGRGSIKVRSKYIYDKENSCIDVTEIPYTTTVEAIIDKIEVLVKEGKLKEITDVRDETDLSGLKLTIDIKKNVDADFVMQKLFKLTSLQDTFSCNFNVLIDEKPKLLGVKQIIQEWVKFRKQCLKRELQYDIQQLQLIQNELLGLQIILQDLDKAISLIRSSKSEKEAIDKLREFFNLNDKQLEYVIKIRMVNMNQEWLTSKINKLTEVNKQLRVNLDNLESDSYYVSTIISQLQDVKKKYGQPRRTTIIQPEETVSIKQNELIEDYNCQIVLTKENYLKKTLRYSDNQKLKDGDTVMQQIPSSNKAKLLFFTDKDSCYYLNVWDIDSTQPSNLGNFLPSLLQLQDEKVIYVVSTVDFKGHIMFAFENGKVAKIPLSSYETKTNRSKVINAYNTDSKLVSINYIDKDVDFMAVSSIDKLLVVNTSQINAKASKTSQGIQLLKSKNDSVMVEFKPVDIDNVEYYRGSPNQIGKYLID
jgi:DNA gyrase subunit A